MLTKIIRHKQARPPETKKMSAEHAEIEPDWEHWLNMSEVKAREFILLSLNIEPQLFPNHSPTGRLAIRSKQLEEVKRRSGSFQTRLDQLISAVESQSSKSIFCNAIYRIPPGDKSLVTLHLTDCLTWAATLPRPWSVPEQLASLAEETRKIRDSPGAKELPDDPRLIKSFERILLSLAFSHFGFDPDKGKNNAAKDIHLETKKYGLEVSVATIRQKLKNATENLVDQRVREKIQRNRNPSGKPPKRES